MLSGFPINRHTQRRYHMSRLDNCLTAIVGDRVPLETARKTFFFLVGIIVMLIVITLPIPEPFYKGTEAIPLTQSAKCVMGALCFAVIMWMTEAIPFPATSLSLIVLLHVMNIDKFSNLVKLGLGNSAIIFLMGAMGLSGHDGIWACPPFHVMDAHQGRPSHRPYRTCLHYCRSSCLHVGHGYGRRRHAAPAWYEHPSK